MNNTANKNPPVFSVVVPAYNEENYIEDCLDSIVNQEFPKKDYEIIAVDNNSTDNMAEIIRKKYPQVTIFEEKKQGVVFARITGVEKAKGKIIAFIDADSIAPSLWLKNLKTAYENPCVVGVGGKVSYEPKRFVPSTVGLIGNVFNQLFKMMTGVNSSFRKDAYHKCGGYSPKINFDEDVYLSLSLKKTGKIVFLKDNPVITSSRRYTSSNFFPYLYQTVINVFFIFLCGKSVFFYFEPVRNGKIALKKILNKIKTIN